MSEQTTLLAEAKALVATVQGGKGAAVLTTVSPRGKPHATWMGTVSPHDSFEILTITSPDSEKMKNIEMNPNVEWMFTDAAQETVIYMSGIISVVRGVEEIKAMWDLIPDKKRAFFLPFYNTGIGFALLKTKVESVTYCRPQENLKVELPVEGLTQAG